MSEMIDWRGDAPAEILAPAAAALAEGHIVALPTESGYELAAAGLNPSAVARLCDLTASTELPAIVLSGAAEAVDWLPWLATPGTRLIRKLGAGPWKLIADGGAAHGLLRHLPPPVQLALCPDRHLALRWPDAGAWTWLARCLQQPLVSAGVGAPATAEALGDLAALVVDMGPCGNGQPTTLMRVTGKAWQIERPGGLAAGDAAEALLCHVLFVCTGNTCRSPMAEALMKRLLADRLGCAPDDLRQRGFLVQSAGLSAIMGAPASPDAVVAVQGWGADLAGHRSRPLSLELLLADHVFAMTGSHWAALAELSLSGMPAPQLLSPDGFDVFDPIGSEPEVYRACASEICEHLQRRLPEIMG